MAQRESRLSRKIMEALRAEGVFCFKVHGSEFTMAGLPDIICCIDGEFVGLETKLPETVTNLSARQKYVHTQIESAGGKVFVVWSKESALETLSKVRKSAGK